MIYVKMSPSQRDHQNLVATKLKLKCYQLDNHFIQTVMKKYRINSIESNDIHKYHIQYVGYGYKNNAESVLYYDKILLTFPSPAHLSYSHTIFYGKKPNANLIFQVIQYSQLYLIIITKSRRIPIQMGAKIQIKQTIPKIKRRKLVLFRRKSSLRNQELSDNDGHHKPKIRVQNYIIFTQILLFCFFLTYFAEITKPPQLQEYSQIKPNIIHKLNPPSQHSSRFKNNIPPTKQKELEIKIIPFKTISKQACNDDKNWQDRQTNQDKICRYYLLASSS
eukprot:TRINITY_DN4413_c1_g1_i6.p1 TRINITY_DN4413_c1_g1~~TRINITY_DN4413_c1_g1_i6.p1  ORF type:complete len:277 (+),score=-10.74 TRINITY_DN4413_c1_g1_i6:891-1721(+)